LPLYSRSQREDGFTLALVSRGDEAENRTLAEEHGLERVLLQNDREVAERYGAYATPSAVLVGADGRIAHELVAGTNAVEELAATARPVAQVGSVARLAAASAIAATAAVIAPHAKAEEPTDPEVQAIGAVLTNAEPRILRATKRAKNAVRVAQAAGNDAARRKKRAAAATALDAQREEVLALRAELEKLQPVGAAGHSVRVLSLQGLALFAESLQHQGRALVATPKASARLLRDSEDTLDRSLPLLLNAAKYLRRG
jgi:hypothetical protein